MAENPQLTEEIKQKVLAAGGIAGLPSATEDQGAENAATDGEGQAQAT